MFNRKEDTGYRVLAEGVQLKTLVHGEKTHLCEFRIARGGGSRSTAILMSRPDTWSPAV